MIDGYRLQAACGGRGTKPTVQDVQWPVCVNYPLLRYIHANVKKEKILSPSIEIAVTGIQNRRILNGLLLSRLAAKNIAKNEIARIQNKGEKRLSKASPATAAKPVALELFMPRRAKTTPGPSREINTAATALRTPRTVVIGSSRGNRHAQYSTQKASLMGRLLKNRQLAH